jgi:hypothetical protein
MIKTKDELKDDLKNVSQKIKEFYPDCKTYLYKSDKYLQKAL